jgi:hypothetical protein
MNVGEITPTERRLGGELSQAADQPVTPSDPSPLPIECARVDRHLPEAFLKGTIRS